ncbi:hypothetical protein COM97_27060 [Bacillus thuringiensis]|uniref:hypothetical protein n=1 Tax=Bacillus thuringiensis TaxID=1428 RepID=UPI000BEC3C94|nr:hypothetical protein [Bacillus thuringiensis]PEF03403.1 hypothetical protein COM97_27060 [Bacillus thuringiensis]
MKLTVNTQEAQERFTRDDLIQIKYRSGVEYTYAVISHKGIVFLYNLDNGHSGFSQDKAEDVGELLRAIKKNPNVRGYRILSADEYEMQVVRKAGA